MFEWILSALLSCFVSYLLMFLFRLENFRDKVVALTTLFFMTVTFSTFVAGAIIHSLTNTALLAVNAVLFAIVVLIVYRLGLISPGRFRRSFTGFRTLGKIGWVYGITLCSLLLLTAVVGYLLPPYAYDAIAYHLVAVASWVHAHRIGPIPTSLWADTYPKNAELFYAWLYLFDGTGHWLHMGQWLYGLAGIIAVMGTGRWLGLSRGSAVMAGTLFFMAPTVLLQATTDYNDLAFTAMFLLFFYFYVRFLSKPSAAFSILAGIAAGLTLGMKSSAVMYIGICFVGMAIRMLLLWRRRDLQLQSVIRFSLAFAGPVLLLGTYWYIHTWIFYGNPVYPFTIAFHGHVLFAGQGTVQNLIMRVNTPSYLQHKPVWQQVWIAWTSLAKYYAYDMPVGGFGIQWTVLEFPVLVLFIGYALWKKRNLFYVIVLPLLLIFVLQPANWWGRYTMFMPALGAWAFVFMVDVVARRRVRVLFHGLMMFVLGGSLVGGAVVFTVLEHKDSGMVQSVVQRVLRTPLSKRTVGDMIYPQYHWVDEIRHSTTIGATQDVSFLYPLYGKGARNEVVLIHARTQKQFLSELRNSHVRYFMFQKGERYEKWTRENPGLLQFYSSSKEYDVYSVQE